MNIQERTGMSGITTSDVDWYVSPGTFERMENQGYTQAAFGGGDWVYESHKIPLLVGLAGGQAYRIPAMWAFFHPAGKIAVVENPKARIRHENGEQQHTPLTRSERTFGLFGRFGARHAYELFLKTYEIQMGEPFELQELMNSEVYQTALHSWRLNGHMRIHKVQHLFGRFGPKILGEELPPPPAGMPFDNRNDLVLRRIKGHIPEEPAYIRFARVIGPGQVVIGECRDEIRDDYLREINDGDINRDPEIKGRLRFVMS